MSSNITKAFADNLSDLISDSGKTLKELASEIGVSPAILSKYQNDFAEAGIDNAAKIANYFHVSLDWLIGRTTVRSPNVTIKKVCAYTGLSEKAVEFFHNWTMPDLEVGPSYLSFLSQLIGSMEFDIFTNNLFQFYYAVAAKQILNEFPTDRQRSIQMTLHKLTRGNAYIKLPQLREKLEEYSDFLWASNREAYTLDVPDVYEYHVTQALNALLCAERDLAQVQAVNMLSDTIDNLLMQVDSEKIDFEEEDFIDGRLKQLFPGLTL